MVEWDENGEPEFPYRKDDWGTPIRGVKIAVIKSGASKSVSMRFPDDGNLWRAYSPDEARAIAKRIIEVADEIDAENPK